MRRIVLALVLLLSFAIPGAARQPKHSERSRISPSKPAASPSQPPQFVLWEKQADLRKRMGEPQEYFVPTIQKIIHPAELRYYSDNYQKIDDVFYRDTPVGEVRIVVAYARDESQGHLHPEIRVEKVHFFFDKDVNLRTALASIVELRELCAGGCILNGFSSSVVAQPAKPSNAQIKLAGEMKPHWRGQDMSDATPGAEVYYVDSPYPVDFEHSSVERIDYTLISNAGRERYTLAVVNKQPTVLDMWHPRVGDLTTAGRKKR